VNAGATLTASSGITLAGTGGANVSFGTGVTSPAAISRSRCRAAACSTDGGLNLQNGVNLTATKPQSTGGGATINAILPGASNITITGHHPRQQRHSHHFGSGKNSLGSVTLGGNTLTLQTERGSGWFP